jgi:hypothetical protein
MRSLPGVLTSTTLCIAMLGCHDPGPAPSSEATPIINGTPDSTYAPVVAYLHGGKCSATIVHVDGDTGYAVTAAHCISGQLGLLRQGDNHANGSFDVE